MPAETDDTPITLDAAPSRPRTRGTGPLGYAAYAGLRAAMMLPQIAGPAAALEAARVAGRAFGSAPFNRKRIDRATESLGQAMPHLEPDRRRELALRSYEHLAMLAVEVAFLPRILSEDAWTRHIHIGSMAPALQALLGDRPAILITGHAGNWEAMGYTVALLGVRVHALYRPLDLAPLDRWVRRTRERRGLSLLDKFGAVRIAPELLERREPVAFVADQNAGDRGLFVPYFGRLTSTYKSIGLLALKHRAVLVCGFGRRVGWDERPGERGIGRHVGENDIRFTVHLTDVFGPEEYESQPDPLYYLTARYRRALEKTVLAAPEQYLWMHRIWKSRPRHERLGKPFPDALRAKLAALPWMDDATLGGIVERSDRDRAFLNEHGLQRLP
ncbi:MAG: lysophospholipid acyltransferase family protein [Phycisphaeraceae bacterium]|nr:MAG: lysophospholipid acyltransferase family protein [Phycisphaeraceae bacterium]